MYESPSSSKAAHEYVSQAWSWPWIGHPVHHWQLLSKKPPHSVEDIVGLPNPFVWIPAFFIGIPVLTWRALRRRDATAALLTALVLAGYLPFLVRGLLGGSLYLFYMTPVVPLLALTMTHVIARVEHRRRAGSVGWNYLAACAIVFIFFYPVLSGVSIEREGVFGWKGRIWLQLDCSSKGVRAFCWR